MEWWELEPEVDELIDELEVDLILPCAKRSCDIDDVYRYVGPTYVITLIDKEGACRKVRARATRCDATEILKVAGKSMDTELPKFIVVDASCVPRVEDPLWANIFKLLELTAVWSGSTVVYYNGPMWIDAYRVLCVRWG